MIKIVASDARIIAHNFVNSWIYANVYPQKIAIAIRANNFVLIK